MSDANSTNAPLESLDEWEDFVLDRYPEPGEKAKEDFRKIAHTTFDILKPLDRAVKMFFKPKGKIVDIREATKEVGVQETQVDRQEWAITTALFADAGLDLSVKLHAKHALSRIVELSDRAEDCAEQIELVAVKSVN